MTKPKRRREKIRAIWKSPDQDKLAVAAAGARYVGSPEHKDAPSFAGRLSPRSDATICDPQFVGRQDELTALLRQSILAGNVGGFWEGEFPRYVWCRHGDDVYEARLTNQGKGEYKAFKLHPSEEPKGMT